jgi:hypothetical protein
MGKRSELLGANFPIKLASARGARPLVALFFQTVSNRLHALRLQNREAAHGKTKETDSIRSQFGTALGISRMHELHRV